MKSSAMASMPGSGSAWSARGRISSSRIIAARNACSITCSPLDAKDSLVMPHPAFDRSRLRIQPLAQRQHDLDLSAILLLDAALPSFDHPALPQIGRRLVDARSKNCARILLMGAHVLRAGVARHLIDLMER